MKTTTVPISNLNKAGKLDSPIGRVVSVPLDLLPACYGIHKIKPDSRYPYAKPGTFEENQILIVRKSYE